MPRIRIAGSRFRDDQGREVHLRGINVDAGGKNPPNLNSHLSEDFYEGDTVSFVNRPFPLEEAPLHFARLRNWGYTTIRWIFTWEALEHAGPGKYDDDFVEYTVACLRIAKKYEIMVIMDPHQDTWSRFTGGSGAPMWTLYACGLDPKKFPATEAALVQNTWPDPADFPKMIWATNYYRMACQVMFTLFWAGKIYAHKAIIDGVNIQDYLQGHFIGAVAHLAKGIVAAGDLIDEVVIGWETINEPNRGLVGTQDMTVVPKEQVLQKGTSPTAWQAILLGSGRACEVDFWDVGGMGPHKTGSRLVDPEGESIWLSTNEYDMKYGFKRDDRWSLGQCIWAQHGIWDPKSDDILRKDYFSKDPRTGDKIDYLYFTNHWFMDYFRAYRDALRAVHITAILFLQPPTLEIPPAVKGTADEDGNIVFAFHWYDGLTLMNKKWNSWWNVDVFGVLRGKYLSPAFAIKLGEANIRACFRDQLAAMRAEGLDQIGNVPSVLTETGIPFDLSQGKAYETGDYSDQVSALDAVHFGIEGSGIQGYTLWNYTASNTHQWGDNWNGEDLSIISLDDPLPPTSPSHPDSSSSYTTTATLKHTHTNNNNNQISSLSTHRALSAHLRPWPRLTHGTLTSSSFTLSKCTFTLSLTAPSPTPQDHPTEIFLPDWHFPSASPSASSAAGPVVQVSGGKYEIVSVPVSEGREEHGGGVQLLRWWHGEGEQRIQVKGLVRSRAAGSAMAGEEGEEGEGGYLEMYRRMAGCRIM